MQRDVSFRAQPEALTCYLKQLPKDASRPLQTSHQALPDTQHIKHDQPSTSNGLAAVSHRSRSFNWLRSSYLPTVWPLFRKAARGSKRN